MNVIREAIWMYIFQIFRSSQIIVAESKVLPGQVTHFVGEDINLSCAYLLINSVYWDRSPLGTNSPQYIYTGKSGIIGEYKSGKRHSVVLNEISRTCDLVIVNITVGDAGAYTCSTGGGIRTDYELIVLDSSPTCSSNISLAGVLLENDCNIDPDYIELNCTISYHGNLAPVLEWRQSNKDDVIISSVHHSRSSSALLSTHRVSFLPDIQQNGSQFECSLKDNNMAPIQRQLCATQRISFSYFFNTSETRIMNEFVGDLDNVPCSANSSEICSYRWQATEIGTNITVPISSQTLSLIPKYFEIYNNLRCFAECKIRNKSCTVQPLELRLEITAHREDDNRVAVIVIPLIAVLCLLIIGITAVVIIFRKRLPLNQESDMEIAKPLIMSFEDWQRPRCSPNVLLEELVKRQIITPRESKQILKEQRHPPPTDKNEIILRKLFETVKTEYPSKMSEFVTTVEKIDDFYCISVKDNQTTIPLANETTEVAGIAYLNNTLFIVCFYSSEAIMLANLMTHRELNPNVRKKESWKRLTIKNCGGDRTLEDPYGMVACTKYNSIFILEDKYNSGLWKIQMLAQSDAGTNIISRHEISGEGRGISINSSNQLVVLVLSPNRGMLVEIYDPFNLKLESSINLILNEEVFHIHPTSENNFLLFQQQNNEGLFMVKEVSSNGRKVVQKFDPSKDANLNWRDFSVGGDKTYEIRDMKDARKVFESGVWYDEDPYERRYWYPDHLLIDEHGHVFVVDKTRKGVLLLNKHSLSPRVLISRNMINRGFPSRVCYVREHRLLIVGHISSFESDASPSISIFELGLKEKERPTTKTPTSISPGPRRRIAQEGHTRTGMQENLLN